MIYPREQLTDDQKVELFRQFVPMAHKFAGRFSRTFGVSLETMTTESLSMLSLVVARWECQQVGYNPTKTSQSTYIYRALYYGLYDLMRRDWPKEKRLADRYDAPKRSTWLERLLRTLGEDARTVVTVLLFAPAEIAAELEPTLHRARDKVRAARERHRLAVRQYFVAQGWTAERADAAWLEVGVSL